MQRLEHEMGWERAGWIREPELHARPLIGRSLRAQDRAAVWLMARRHEAWDGVARELRSADLLIVSGAVGTLIAWTTGLPFFIWPHGADIRAAVAPRWRHVSGDALKADFVGRLLARAYADSVGIATHGPALGGIAKAGEEAFGQIPVLRLPLPVAVAPEHDAPRVNGDLESILGTSLDHIPDTARIILVPSRIDFGTKGHDLLLHALAEFPRDAFHTVFLGWGSDRDRAERLAARLRLSERVTFAHCVLSKPLLLRAMTASDLVADQFVIGTYGSAALEAMSRGVPVMMRIDPKPFAARGWSVPPVLNAATVSEIRKILTQAMASYRFLEDAGRRSRSWIEREHSPAAFCSALTDLVNAVHR